MKMKSRRFLSLLLCLCMLVGNVLPAYAAETETEEESPTIETQATEPGAVVSDEDPLEENEPVAQSEPSSDPAQEPTEEPSGEETDPETATGGQFALAVLTVDEIVIAPTYITYTANQTIAQALLDSEFEFGGLVDEEETSGWIQAIEGVSASYSLFYDENGYDLTARADSITALCVTTKVDHYCAEYLELIKTMADYNASTNGVQDYAAAAQAYAAAELELYTAGAEKALQLQQALNDAMEAYEKFASGELLVLSIDVPGAADLKLTGQFGNGYEVTFEDGVQMSLEVAPGEYDFDLSDGSTNHVRGTISVQEDTTLTAELPTGQWLASMDIGIANGSAWKAVEKLDDWTFLVPDYSGRALYPCFVPAEGLDTSVCGMYLVGGERRVWNSHQTVLARVVEADSMTGTTLDLEARQPYGDYEQVQTYSIEIIRVPSLSDLEIYSDGTKLPLAFDPEVYEYELSTTGNSVDLYPAALNDGTVITVNGEEIQEGTANVILDEGITEIAVTVTHENGQSDTYTLNVEKLSSVDVYIETEAESVEVFNGAGASIQPVGGVYALVPGETYTYVTTTNDYYHTSASFTASDGLTIDAPAPETTDALKSLAVAAANNAAPFDVDADFEPWIHEYTYQVGSNETNFGIMAAMNEAYSDDGYTMTAIYKSWNTARDQEKEIKPNFTNCILFVGVTGVGNTMNLRVSKEVGGVTYYQDYILTAQRRLQLNGLSLSASGEPLVLNRENATGFLKFDLEYTADVGQTVDKVQMDLQLFYQPNDDQVQVTVSCGEWTQVLDYSNIAVDQIQSIDAPIDPALDAETIEIALEREGATTQVYTVELKKLPPVETVITVDPADALVHLTDDVTGLRVLPEETGEYILNTSRSYTYIITQHGYLTANASFVAGEGNEEISIKLTEAPASDLKDIALDTDYLSFRGNAENNGITDALTPILAEEAVLNWANKIGEGMSGGGVGSPIIVGGDLYTYAATNIYRLDKETGEILASAPMDHASSFSITPPAYGEGMIFVALANGGIQAFNAETLESLWIYTDKMGGQPNCPVIYKDGYIYTGFWNAENKDANYVCICVTDEDPTQEKEAKLASWTYTHNGFYWAGAYVSDDYLLITTDDGSDGCLTGYGSILSIDPKTGLLLDSLTMPGVGDLRTSVCYDEVTDAFYFASKGGDFYCVKTYADGTFVEDSLKQLRLTNGSDSAKNPPMCTSTPVVYNGRAYIGVSGTGQFVSYSGHNITVIDLKNWKIAYTVPTQGYPQTSGLLTTAYEDDKEYVYVYFLDNYTPGKLRVIRDTAGQNTLDTTYCTTETYKKSGKEYSVNTGYVLFTPSSAQAQYAICSPIVDEKGNLYFKNDSGYLMCLGSAMTELVIAQEPETLVYEVGQVFDSTGLQVTAVYANGLEQDVTQYALYSKELLRAEDTEFTITVSLGQYQAMYHNQGEEVGVEYYLPSATIDLTVNTDHTWDSGTQTKAPTCVDLGEMTFVCSVCEHTKKEPIPEIGNHTWDEGIVTTQPTGTQEGVKTYTCTVCDTTKTETVPATGEHTWDEGKVTKAPTCTVSGIKTYTCTECGETKQIELAATGSHTWDQGQVVKEASVIAEGEKLFTCTVCKEERTEVIAKQEPCDGGDNCPGKVFSDWVAKSNWAHTGMDYAVTHGLMNGVGNGKFDPKGELTRGMLVTILWRYAGSEDVGLSEFSDVGSHKYYAKAIAWAAKYGIVNGLGDNKFGPDNKITREQIATILYRYAGYLGLDTSKKGDFSAFEDGEKVSKFAVEALRWATANEVLSGSYDNGKLYLNPDQNATRAQASKLFMSYIELILK